MITTYQHKQLDPLMDHFFYFLSFHLQVNPYLCEFLATVNPLQIHPTESFAILAQVDP